MPPSSAAARSLALAVIGVGAASFAARGQNVTAFNPDTGAGLPGGQIPQYAGQDAAATVNADPAAPPDIGSPVAASGQTPGATLPPPPPAPIKSRFVAVPELTTNRSEPGAMPAAAPALVTIAPPPTPPARGAVAVAVAFTARSTELSEASKAELDRLAKDLSEHTLRQVELRTVADNGDPDSRKISLARALIVRNYLMDKGVRSNIEIAAIVGEGGERVEILVPKT